MNFWKKQLSWRDFDAVYKLHLQYEKVAADNKSKSAYINVISEK